MKTSDQQVAQSETLEQIADRIAYKYLDKTVGSAKLKLVEKVKNWLGKAGFDYGPLIRELELLNPQESQTRDRVQREILSALRRERDRCAKIAEVIPDSKFDLDHEPALTEQQIRDGISRAIRQAIIVNEDKQGGSLYDGMERDAMIETIRELEKECGEFRDAATLMRDKCVEQVKASGAYWREVSKKFQRGDEEFAFFTAKAKAADDLEKELESLTLDQVKPGEM